VWAEPNRLDPVGTPLEVCPTFFLLFFAEVAEFKQAGSDFPPSSTWAPPIFPWPFLVRFFGKGLGLAVNFFLSPLPASVVFPSFT